MFQRALSTASYFTGAGGIDASPLLTLTHAHDHISESKGWGGGEGEQTLWLA